MPGLTPHGDRRPAVVVGLTLVLVVVLALVAGTLWEALAPLARVAVVAPGRTSYANPEDSSFIAADGIFFLVTGSAGVICGLALRVLARETVPWHPVLLALASFAASALAWRVGMALGPGALSPRVAAVRSGGTLDAPLELRGTVALVAWPMVALVAYLATAAAASGARRARTRAG